MVASCRGNRGRGFDRMVLFFADRIVAHQLSGIQGIRELAEVMGSCREYGGDGQPWSYGRMRRVLVRGAQLGVLLPQRSLSEAASQRAPNYRSRSRTDFPVRSGGSASQGDRL